MVPRIGIEPMTWSLEGSRSIQLSYRGMRGTKDKPTGFSFVSYLFQQRSGSRKAKLSFATIVVMKEQTKNRRSDCSIGLIIA